MVFFPMIEITPLASSSKGNAYLLDDGEAPLLVECGIPFKALQKATGFRLSSLAGCLITHEHQDHCRAMDNLREAGIDIYSSGGTFGAHLNPLRHHRQHTVKAGNQFNIGEPFAPGPWTVLPFSTVHDAAEPLGYLIYHRVTKEKILFAIDTMYIKHSFKGLTHIMIEASYDKPALKSKVENGDIPTVQASRLMHNHQSIETALGFLKGTDMSKVKAVYLMHLSGGNSDEEQFKKQAQRVTGRPVYICEE